MSRSKRPKPPPSATTTADLWLRLAALEKRLAAVEAKLKTLKRETRLARLGVPAEE